MVGHPFLYIFFAYFASLPQFTCNKILFNNIALPGNDKRFEIFVFVKYLVKYFLNVLNLLEVGQWIWKGYFVNFRSWLMFLVSFQHCSGHRFFIVKHVRRNCFPFLGTMNALLTSEELSLKLWISRQRSTSWGGFKNICSKNMNFHFTLLKNIYQAFLINKIFMEFVCPVCKKWFRD